jgi:hypothetical protein
MMLKTKILLAAVAAGLLGTSANRASEPEPIPPRQFADLHRMIRPQPGESLFWQVPWLLSLDEALRRGAAEGKPVLVWSGAGGAPHTVC